MGFLGKLAGGLVGLALAPATGGTSLLLWTAGGAIAGEVVESIRDDSIEAEARSEGYKDGVKDTEVATAEKLAKVLEKDDALRNAVLALGICVANIDNEIVEEEQAQIQLMTGQLDSHLVSDKLKNDYKRILEQKPNFAKVKNEYLVNVSNEHLAELNVFVNDIIEADNKVTKEEEQFLNNEWIPYLKGRGVSV